MIVSATRFSFFTNTSARFATAVAVLLMAGGVLLTACGSDEPAIPPASSSPSAGAVAVPAPNVNPTAQTVGGSSATEAAPNSGEPNSGEPISVVTGNVVLADLAANVGGERVSVYSLVGAGSDVHTWRSTPRDNVRIGMADLTIVNGAGLASGVEDLIDSAASADAIRVVASEGLEPQELVELPFPGDDDHGDEESAELHGRLFVGDGEGSGLSVIDLESNEVHQDQFDLGSRAGRIYSDGTGRFAIAVSSDANTAHVFDGGIYLEEHGDHFDEVESEATRLDIDLAGDRPVHLYTGHEWSAIFYDGSGDVVLINHHELEEDGGSLVPVRFNVGAQHGAALPLEDDLVAATIPDPNYPADPEARSPIGAAIHDLEGNVLYRAEGCPRLHGDASNGHMAAFGCVGGVLVLEAHDGDYGHEFIAAPSGSAEDFRLTSVWGYDGLDRFYALGSSVGLYTIEAEAGLMEELIPATDDVKPIQVALSHDGERLLVVMSDGELRMYDAHDADLLASASGFLSDDLDTSFWARPHIATSAGYIFVTDSAAGEVIALDDHDLEVVQHWDVAGKPTKIAFVGILGTGEHPEQGHDDHGHDDDDEGDPHFWLNPRLVVHYVNQIADGLAAADPEYADLYRDNAAAYIAELEELDAYIVETLAGIPDGHRVIVTFHDAFGYFGSRYDLEVMSFVGSHSGDVSPDDIARVLDLVEDEGLPAVFAEGQMSDDAVNQVARDTGIEVGLIRSLPDETHLDYIGMMRANADALATLLR